MNSKFNLNNNHMTRNLNSPIKSIKHTFYLPRIKEQLKDNFPLFVNNLIP